MIGAHVSPLRRIGTLFTLFLLFAIGCGDNLTPPERSSAKEITAFSFTAAANSGLSMDVEGTINGTQIAATVPSGTDVTALVATFTTTGVSVSAGGAKQESGVTAHDFTNPAVYTVTAEDGTTRDFTVTVTVAGGAAKELTAFRFAAADNTQLTADVVATINGTQIAATVPSGTDVTALVATFTTTGTSVTVGGTAQTSGDTANDFTSPVTYTVTAADNSTQDYTVTVTIAADNAKELTAFSFLSVDNAGLPADVTATISGTDITATVPFGTDVTALVATFTTTGASVRVGTDVQTSGDTANDFTSPVDYVVTAADNSTQTYTVTVTVAGSPDKDLTAFSFVATDNSGVLSTDVIATFGGTDNTEISATVPFGTDVTALVATFTTTGASVRVDTDVQTSGMTANDFSSPVTYTVVAADNTTKDYTVTVTVAPNDAKAITAFSFESALNAVLSSNVVATIDEDNHTIEATVPFGTNVTALVATFTFTGTSVAVGADVQASGVTPNDFTSPVTYTVTAADGSTQAYVVTITVGPGTPDKDLTAFSFTGTANGLPTDFAGVITGTTIAVRVPTGTTLTALVATFTTTGATVDVNDVLQVSDTTPNDFSSPVTYTVTAQDGSEQDYTVTVTTADYCGDLPAPTNGSVVVDTDDGFAPGTATYSCDTGYALSSTDPVACTDGTWDPAPTCDPVASTVASFMVVKVGDGTATPGATGTLTVVEERRLSDGVVINTIPLPTVDAAPNHSFVATGNATSDGYLSLSTDGRYVTLGGYSTTLGGTTKSASSTAVPRVVARIDAAGNVDTSTLIDGFSGQNIRSVATVDGSAFWAGGSAGGVLYTTFGSTGAPTTISTMPGNIRQVGIFDGQLYAVAASSVSQIGSDIPTTTGQMATALPVTLSGISEIVMLDLNPIVDGVDTLYVALESGAAANTLNVQKWTYDGTTWTNTGFAPTISPTFNPTRMTAIVDGGVVHLIALTPTQIVTVDDDGVNLTPDVTSFAAGSAGTNYAFRGVAQSPYAE